MEQNDKMIESLKSKLLQRQFMYNQQGYTLIKYMVFKYALEEVGIEFPSIKEFDCKLSAHFEHLKSVIYENLDKIAEVLGEYFKGIVLDCIVSFSLYNSSDSDFEQSICIIEDMTIDAIRDFVVSETIALGGRESCSTPQGLCELVNGIMNADKTDAKLWLDLGCGDGNFLVQTAIRNPQDVFVGVEINYNSYLLTCIRLAFLKVKNRIFNNDIMDYSGKVIADCVFCHPPFALRSSMFKNINENQYVGNIKPFQTAEWAFVEIALKAMSNKGKGCIIVPDGILTNIADLEQRELLVSKKIIEGIIKLPADLFEYTSVATSLLILNKDNQNDFIKFVDASNLCTKGRRFSELDADAILNEYFNNGENSINVPFATIVEANYNLSIKRFKEISKIKLRNPRRIGELVLDIFRGVQIQARLLDKYTTLDHKDSVYKIVNCGDIVDGSFNTKELGMIDVDKNLDRYLLCDGDVLITSKSTKVKTAIAEIRNNEKIIPSGSIIVIRCNKELINPVYLKTFFDSNVGKKLLESIQTGTTIISINAGAIRELAVECLPLDKQNVIANAFLQKMDLLRYERQKVLKLENELNTIFDSLLED